MSKKQEEFHLKVFTPIDFVIPFVAIFFLGVIMYSLGLVRKLSNFLFICFFCYVALMVFWGVIANVFRNIKPAEDLSCSECQTNKFVTSIFGTIFCKRCGSFIKKSGNMGGGVFARIRKILLLFFL